MSKITLKRAGLFCELLVGDALGLLIILFIGACLSFVMVSAILMIAFTALSFFKAFGSVQCFAWLIYLGGIFVVWIPTFLIWIKMHWENSESIKREEIS